MGKTIKKIKKIISYIPLLWNDEDWDFYFLFKLMQFKIDRMEKTIRTNNLFVGVEDVCQEMKDCSEHIDKFLNYDDEDTTIEMIANMSDEERRLQYQKEEDEKQAHFVAFLDILKEKSQGWWD